MADGSCKQVAVRGQQGNISLVITGLRPGTVTISWEAKDPYGANITRTMQVTVEPPPAISSPGFRLALAGIGVAAAAAIVAAVLVQRRRRGAQTAVGAQAGPAFPAAPAAGATSVANDCMLLRVRASGMLPR